MVAKPVLWSAIALFAIAIPICTHSLSPLSAQPARSNEAAQIDIADINELAARTTVVIAQDLARGDVESGTAFEPGSGAIVAKVGKTYYVATNVHVVRLTNVAYGVRSFDGKIHTVQPNDRAFGIHRFGEEQRDRTIRGLDLAIITFESDDNYPQVDINLAQINRGSAAFVSGWPEPPAAGQAMQRRFAPGEVSNVKAPSPDGGYGLFYTSSTAVGMSGGPVFNHRGQVIGIHGRGSEFASAERANQGIPVNSLTQNAEQAKRAVQMLSRLQFSTQLPSAALIASWRQDHRKTADVFKDPEAAFREAFRQSALRYCSQSRVDTGDPQDNCR